MLRIQPFKGYLVAPEHAEQVVTPPYDALSPRERFDYANTHPRNYLNVMRSLEEFPDDERPALDEMLKGNASRLTTMVKENVFLPMGEPCLFVYRLRVNGHEQTGLVSEIPIDAYFAGNLKKHEHTQQEGKQRLIDYQRIVGVSSSPVCMAYPSQAGINALIGAVTESPPAIELTTDDGVMHSIWCIEDPAAQTELCRAFATIPVAYLTDGHHRTAAAADVARRCREQLPGYTGDEPFNFLLSALFPHDQLRVFPYNRCVRDLNGYSVAGLLEVVAEDFEIEDCGAEGGEQATPRGRGEVGMLLDGCWYKLQIRPGRTPTDDPVRALDVMVLQEHLIGPILGIKDQRSDARIHFIPGSFGLDYLESFCRDGWRVAFNSYPTSLEELMQVADADEVMPPKSTWFDPKVRSGFFLRVG